MRPLFIALLHQIKVSEDLGDGDKIKDDLRITNNANKIGSLLGSTHRGIIGEMETESLLSGAPVVLSQAEIPPDQTPQQYLLSRLYEVQAFLMSTWINRDNSINCELGFLLYHDGPRSIASSNFLSHLYSTSSGQRVVTHLSREELRDIRVLYREAVGPPNHPFLLPISQLTDAHPRLTRAIFLLNAARGESDVAMKVAHYCAAFETLFATSQAELSHQLSERLSCYLFALVDDRLAAYRSLKGAYSVRSKVVHGATVKEQRLADIVATSNYCDSIARKLFQLLVHEPDRRKLFDQGHEAFDENMLRIIFTGALA